MRCTALLVLVLLAGCGAAPANAQPKAAFRMPVVVDAAALRPIADQVRAGGTLEPAEIVQVSARVAGAVERVLVEAGTAVEAGAVLVEIEPERFRIAADRAAAALARAEAQLQEARAGLARREELSARGADLVQAEELAAWRSRVAQGEAETALARAGLEQARLDARDAAVRAPLAGVVESRAARLGQYLPVGAAVATQVRRLPLRLRVRVPVEQAALLAVGSAVEVVCLGATLPARLVLVGSAADPATRTVAVEAEVPAAPASVVAGAYAELVAAVGGGSRLAVPAAALRASERGWSVFTVQGDGDAASAKRVAVEPGLRSADGWVEIRRGLEPGQRVIVRGADALRDGQAVRPAER
jgi:multidrug efflux system membrane fusion protein